MSQLYSILLGGLRQNNSGTGTDGGLEIRLKLIMYTTGMTDGPQDEEGMIEPSFLLLVQWVGAIAVKRYTLS